jgi:hypothetical protein
LRDPVATAGEPAPAAFDSPPARRRGPRRPAPRATVRARRANGGAGWLPRLLALAALLAVVLVVASLLGLL